MSTTSSRVVPAIRRMATRLGIDANCLTGSGPDGRVLRDDVRQAALTARRVDTAAARTQRPAAPPAGLVGDELYAAVFGPRPEPSLTADQAQLYASVYGQPTHG